MKYLLGFIRKDMLAENLVQKLCQRFQASDTARQWRELAFCISQLHLSEKGTRKLIDGFRLYKHTLTDVDVFDTMRAMAVKVGSGGRVVKAVCARM